MLSGNQHGALTVDASAVDLEAGDQFFDPTCLTDVSQGTVTLTIENTGQALHNIKLEDQGNPSKRPAMPIRDPKGCA